MLQNKKAYLAALLYTCIIGFSFMFVKLSLTVANPLDTLAHRFTISLLVAIILVLFKKIRLNITIKDIVVILPIAVLYPALFFSFQVFGLVYTSSSEAGIIQATIPIFTLVFATFFLKEHTTKWQKSFTILSVVGVIYIFVMKDLNVEIANLKGAILILLSALSSAGYNVLARKMTKRYQIFELTFIMTIIGCVVFNSMAITNHITNHTLTHYFLPFTNEKFLFAILYLGILSSLCTSFLSNYALSKIEASKMSVFSNLATLITMIAGVIFLHEKLHYFHIVGAIIIVIGVIGTNFSGNLKNMSNLKEKNNAG